MSVTTVPIHPIKKGSLTKIWLGVLLIVGAALLLAYTGTQDAVVNGSTNEQFLAANADEDNSNTVSLGDTLSYTITATNDGNFPHEFVVIQGESYESLRGRATSGARAAAVSGSRARPACRSAPAPGRRPRPRRARRRPIR